MRFARRAGVTAGALAAVAVLAGCGKTNGNLLTPGAATQLTAELNQASSALSQYNCQVAYTALTNFRNDVAQLQGVNATLVQTLSDGAARIDQLANDRCPTGATTKTTTDTGTRTRPTRTSTTVTTVTETTTTSSDTLTDETTTDNGGGAPIAPTQSTPTLTTPALTTASTPAVTTQQSGGAGFGSGGAGAGQ